MTCVTFSMCSPLAATSVATRMLYLPELKSWMTLFLLFWLSPEWMLVAWNRFFQRISPILSVQSFVLQNIITFFAAGSFSIFIRRSSFSFLSTPSTLCLIFLTVISSCCSISVSGFFMYLCEMLMTCAGIVAENSMVCLVFGVALKIFSTSSMNPMSSILSASSKTTNLTFDKSIVRRSMWSSILPGVAIAI